MRTRFLEYLDVISAKSIWQSTVLVLQNVSPEDAIQVIMKLFDIKIHVVVLETYRALLKVSIAPIKCFYDVVIYLCRYLFWWCGYGRPSSGDASYMTSGFRVLPFNYLVSMRDGG
jgi:hypothetical protein